MSLLSPHVRLLAVAAAAMLASQAYAGNRFGTSAVGAPGGSQLSVTYVDVNLAGFQTYGDFGDPANSQVFLSIAPNSTVLGYDYLNLSFTTSGESWQSEFVLSVNNADASEYMDAAPSDLEEGGTFGPASGSWDIAPGGQGGASFNAGAGTLWVTVYELYTDEGLNATVNTGTLRIYYDNPAAVPEPASYGMMGLGLLGIVAAARRRKAA